MCPTLTPPSCRLSKTGMVRTWQVFIKAFARSSNGSRGLLESTGLVETGDCLTAINGDVVGRANLHEIMDSIRSAKSPLTLRFARYPPPPQNPSLSPTSPGSHESAGSHPGSSRSAGHGDMSSSGDASSTDGGAEDAELDAVMNSALVLGLGERVAGIQQRNARVLQTVERIGRAAAAKRAGVEGVASASAALLAEAATLPSALRILSSARAEASAICETMARLDESLAARERAIASRRRMNEGPGPAGAGGALGGALS